jgi:hypothetical protein
MVQHSTTYHFVFVDGSTRMERLPVHSGGDWADLRGLIGLNRIPGPCFMLKHTLIKIFSLQEYHFASVQSVPSVFHCILPAKQHPTYHFAAAEKKKSFLSS